jgi:hypothetical protein
MFSQGNRHLPISHPNKKGEGEHQLLLVQNVVRKESKIVKAKGIIKDVNGKMEFTASQIKLVKDK